MNLSCEIIYRSYLRKNKRACLFEKVIFKRCGYVVRPIAPLEMRVMLSNKEAFRILSKLKGAVLVWTSGFCSEAESRGWYAITLSNFLEVDVMRSRNVRSKIRRGLRGLNVRQVSGKEIGRLGYDVYRMNMLKYGTDERKILDEELFFQKESGLDSDAEFRQQWGAFLGDKMVGYTHVIQYGEVEADYTHMKFHPDYLNKYVSYALLYTMNQYYLGQKRVQYVSDGQRSILHDTNVQDFLEKEFDFERRYLRLHIYTYPVVRHAIMALSRSIPRSFTKKNRYCKAGVVLSKYLVGGLL